MTESVPSSMLRLSVDNLRRKMHNDLKEVYKLEEAIKISKDKFSPLEKELYSLIDKVDKLGRQIEQFRCGLQGSYFDPLPYNFRTGNSILEEKFKRAMKLKEVYQEYFDMCEKSEDGFIFVSGQIILKDFSWFTFSQTEFDSIESDGFKCYHSLLTYFENLLKDQEKELENLKFRQTEEYKESIEECSNYLDELLLDKEEETPPAPGFKNWLAGFCLGILIVVIGAYCFGYLSI